MKSALLLLLLTSGAQAQLVYQSPSSPASTTQNAFSLWGDATGSSLLNTKLLLDSTAMGTGTTTIKPTTGTTNRTFTLPDKDGTPVINNVFDTLNSTFLGEANQWFNGVDTTKRALFSLAAEKTGESVTIQMPGDLNVTSGARTVTLPSFAVGTSSYTLLSNSGTQTVTGWTLGHPTINDFFDVTDYIVNGSRPSNPVSGNFRLYNYGDALDINSSDATVLHVSGFTNTELDFGSTPLTEKSFIVTDTQIKANSTNYTGLDYYVEAFIPRHISTGKTYVDELDMDSFFVSCTPAVGSLTCMVRCLTGQFRGTLKLNYRMVALNQ